MDIDNEDDQHAIDCDDEAVARAFDEAYPQLEDAPPDHSAKRSGKVIGVSHIPANPNALVTAVEAHDRYGIELARIHRWKARGMVPVLDYRGTRPLFSAPTLRALNRAADQDSRSTINDAA